MSGPDFLIHDNEDSVGVVVVETVKAGDSLTGLNMVTQSNVEMTAKSAIPLGHKIALTDIADGDTILKYNADIGKAVAAIVPGDHVHVHNMKTKRW